MKVVELTQTRSKCSHNKKSHLLQGLSPFQGPNYTCGLLVLVYNVFFIKKFKLNNG
jgi:hypothetical protein